MDGEIIAVNIALTLPEPVRSRVIGLNRAMVKDPAKDIVLGEKESIPHITLAMGCVPVRDLPALDNILYSVSKMFPVISLTAAVASDGMARLAVSRDKMLLGLHEKIMADCMPIFSYDVREAMFRREKGESISAGTFDQVRTFPSQFSFEGYEPHVTVGSGAALFEWEPVTFAADNFALFSMGNHCACRGAIYSYKLVENR